MRMRRIRSQRGQTGVAVLLLLVALMALGVSVYTYLQVAEWRDMQSNLMPFAHEPGNVGKVWTEVRAGRGGRGAWCAPAWW